ncbi:MAG: prepilin-type N-terminal cleavage/methylation domain-containing protein [bacterium]|nr:prepilin-type N-terminal cleavage/methylation domain-containing protein [bacterium]
MSVMSRTRRDNGGGFTLLEIVIVVAIIGILAAISSQQYTVYIDRVRVTEAIMDIRGFQSEIRTQEVTDGETPDSLAAAGIGAPLDPWGNPYQFLKIIRPPGPGVNIGQARKDKFLVPINTSFDLYSMGKDGQTKAPLNPPVSRDDVVRANDGSFIGLAEKY